MQVTLLSFHAVTLVEGIYSCFEDRKCSHRTHCGELDYVNTKWYEVVLQRTCQDIRSAGTLNRILHFVLHDMAVYLDMKPSVRAASTCLRCGTVIQSVFSLPELLPSARYCMLSCSSAATTAYSTT